MWSVRTTTRATDMLGWVTSTSTPGDPDRLRYLSRGECELCRNCREVFHHYQWNGFLQVCFCLKCPYMSCLSVRQPVRPSCGTRTSVRKSIVLAAANHIRGKFSRKNRCPSFIKRDIKQETNTNSITNLLMGIITIFHITSAIYPSIQTTVGGIQIK